MKYRLSNTIPENVLLGVNIFRGHSLVNSQIFALVTKRKSYESPRPRRFPSNLVPAQHHLLPTSRLRIIHTFRRLLAQDGVGYGRGSLALTGRHSNRALPSDCESC